MAKTDTDNLRTFILNSLYIFGYDPTRDITITTGILKFISFIAAAQFFVLSVMYFWINIQQLSVAEFEKIVESVITASQVLFKFFTLTKYRKWFGKLFNQMEEFWPPTGVSNDVIEESKNIYNNANKIFKAFALLLTATVVAYSCYGLLGRHLIFLAYVPNKYYMTEDVVIVGEFLYLSLNTSVAIGFDGIFMYMCAKLIIQFKILKYKIENIMTFENPDQELNRCIEHHVMLIDFVNKMIEIYSFYFCAQYFIALISSGLQMFQFSEDTADIGQLIQSIGYASSMLMQFGLIYCYPSQEIRENMLAISEAVYNSDWYNANLNLRRKLLMILTSNQKEYVFTALGLNEISLATFTKLFQASLSMLMFFRHMKQKL